MLVQFSSTIYHNIPLKKNFHVTGQSQVYVEIKYVKVIQVFIKIFEFLYIHFSSGREEESEFGAHDSQLGGQLFCIH